MTEQEKQAGLYEAERVWGDKVESYYDRFETEGEVCYRSIRGEFNGLPVLDHYQVEAVDGWLCFHRSRTMLLDGRSRHWWDAQCKLPLTLELEQIIYIAKGNNCLPPQLQEDA